MKNRVLSLLSQQRASGRKALAVLLDPDKTRPEILDELIPQALSCGVSYFFVGGSLITGSGLAELVATLKKQSQIPVVLFPGSNNHLDFHADAILLLSLISGRNAEMLIGQHVVAAPLLKRSGLEILPTGYMLVDAGVQTTVSYISGTTPIPHDKPEIAAVTAMAGEMLGLRLIYLDAGSGAQRPISARMIQQVRRAVDTPLIVGGGINTPERAAEALNAGADVIVVGNGIEKDPDLLPRIAEKVNQLTANSY